MSKYIKIISAVSLFLLISNYALSENGNNKKVLILVQGTSQITNIAMGDGRQLATLLGHFATDVQIKGVEDYSVSEVNNYDFTFYVGFHADNNVPSKFLNDVIKSPNTIVWINTGFKEFSNNYDLKKTFGFDVSELDSSTNYDVVKFGKKIFTKGEPNANIINISDHRNVNVIAYAVSSKNKNEIPYIVKSNNLYYIADSPFASATESDRYLLFADMLHDILGEQHEESHSAIIRIEDIGPLDDPNKLRDIADLLADKEIPFLFSVYPFYVDPSEGIRVSLSDKPEIVDALKYMVRNGGTLVMHGVTHQYKGMSASDFEFWDESTNAPIKDESAEAFSKKIELGIHEFMKNGLYPLIWETPHYTASLLFYKTISKYFSTAIEQRLSIENFDYSQFFPYIIKKDLFGQTIYPENLGYVPLDETNKQVSRDAVQNIIKGAKTNLYVRDGFASCFFHPFLDLDLLEELVDGVQALGYTYIDLKDETNWVKTKDKLIISGNQTHTFDLEDQYLVEAYFNSSGEIIKRKHSKNRLKGPTLVGDNLKPGQFYKAEVLEFRERQKSIYENTYYKLENLFNKIITSPNQLDEAKPVVLWNHYAKGAAYNDQASFVSVFQSVNINVDTIYVGQKIELKNYNLLVVPFSFVDSLRPTDFDIITKFVEDGGNIITDSKNYLAEELGIKFSDNRLRVRTVRDRYFPEEPISWRYTELVNKFECDDIDETFCVDEITDAPLVIGKRFGKGKLIFINSIFDPYSQQGYSLYPYLLEYVRKYFKLTPIIRKENLEVFFDPGFRYTYSVENLIKHWVNYGIRIIHVAGWHQYPKYTYDYKRLIRLAHANGILVYAWLEPPQVSQSFWLEHPEWREKNYLGEDARPSWRYPVALTDKNCVSEMAKQFMKLLESYDWDGVNFAELYFEAGKGFDEPNHFTPMHPSAIKEVKEKYNIELNNIFNPNSKYYWKHNQYVKESIIEYRVNKLNEIYEIFLAQFSEHAKLKPGFEIIVTAMDSYGSPEMKEFVAVDMERIIQLQKKYNFLLNVQDPQHLWSSDPLRYNEIGKTYQTLVGGKTNLALDLNIMSFRHEDEITPFPTLIQTGTESFHLVRSASLGASRVVIYSESSTNPQDMVFLPYALASEVKYKHIGNGYEFESPYSFYLKLKEGTEVITLDGNPISSSRGSSFLIPAGKRKVKLSVDAINTYSTHELQIKILSSTANILDVSYGMRDVKFTYESNTRTLVSLDQEPSTIKIDNEDYYFEVMKGNDCFTVFLPAGKHSATIVGGNAVTYGINLTSLWSSLSISIFGILAIAGLIVMQIYVKRINKKYLIKTNRVINGRS